MAEPSNTGLSSGGGREDNNLNAETTTETLSEEPMPLLERDGSSSSALVARSSRGTAIRRIVRAVRPKDNGSEATGGGLPVPAPSTSVPLVVHWNLFPVDSGNSLAAPDEDPSESTTGTRPQNHNPYAPLQSDDEESSSDEDGSEEEEEDDDDDEEENEDEEEYEEEHLSYMYDSTQDDEEDTATDDDDDDDDDDEEDSAHDHTDDSSHMHHGMLRFFHMMARLDNENDDEGDEDDSRPCTCPRCLLDQLGCLSQESEINPCEVSETPLDATAPPCAICMEPETTSRTFVHLPCCGSAENTTSTRFCQKCLVRCMAKNGCGVPRTDAQSEDGLLAGECPRCKHLLVLEETSPPNGLPYYQRIRAIPASTQSWHWYIGRIQGGSYRIYLLTLAWCTPHFVPEELLLNDSASPDRILHLCQWGLLKKKTNPNKTNPRNNHHDKRWSYLANIWTRLLSQGEKWMERQVFPWAMIGGGLFRKQFPNSQGWVYQMDPQVQMELRSLLLQHLEIDTDNDLQLRLCPYSRSDDEDDGHERGRNHCFLVACHCAISAWMALCQLRFGRALAIANRGSSLGLLSVKGLLPPVADWPGSSPRQEAAIWHALTLLNVLLFLVGLRILAQAIWIAVYTAQIYALCQFFGSWLAPPKELWKRWLRNGIVLYVSTYGLYRWCWWCTSTTERSSALTEEL